MTKHDLVAPWLGAIGKGCPMLQRPTHLGMVQRCSSMFREHVCFVLLTLCSAIQNVGVLPYGLWSIQGWMSQEKGSPCYLCEESHPHPISDLDGSLPIQA